MTLNTLRLSGKEPLLTPEAARNWLSTEHRLIEEDGQIALPQDASSLAFAALHIARGAKPAKLSDAYGRLSEERRVLSTIVVAALGKEVATLFQEV